MAAQSDSAMAAYLVLLVAALSRLLPHALGGIGLNVTAVGGGLLFFGARRPHREAVFAALTLAATDVYLTASIFHLPFRLRDYAVTWAWYAAMPLLGHALLATASPTRSRMQTARRVALAVLLSATSFFVVSNFMVWVAPAAQHLPYPHTAAGLLACYLAGVPFYARDLVATALTTAALFGLPALARDLHRGLASPARLG